MGSAYCRRNARQRGSALAAANLFGPNCLALFSASAVVRPCRASTPSAASTRSAVSVCHAGTAAPDPGPNAGTVTGEVTLASSMERGLAVINQAHVAAGSDPVRPDPGRTGGTC